MVTATEASYLPSGTVLFDNVILDLRNNFDISSGIFTVPITGKYLFLVDGSSKPSSTHIDLLVNGEVVKYIIDYDNDFYHQSNGMLPIQLESGNEVSLGLITSSQILADKLHPFSFIGILVSEVTTI